MAVPLQTTSHPNLPHILRRSPQSRSSRRSCSEKSIARLIKDTITSTKVIMRAAIITALPSRTRETTAVSSSPGSRCRDLGKGHKRNRRRAEAYSPEVSSSRSRTSNLSFRLRDSLNSAKTSAATRRSSSSSQPRSSTLAAASQRLSTHNSRPNSQVNLTRPRPLGTVATHRLSRSLST